MEILYRLLNPPPFMRGDRRRAGMVAISVLLILTAFFTASASASVFNIPAVNDAQSVFSVDNGGGDVVSTGLFSGDLPDLNLQHSIMDSLHSFTYDKDSGTWQAYNSGEDITVSAGSSGSFVFTTGRGTFGMALAGVGHGADLKAPGKGVPDADGRSLTFVYNGFSEWYKNHDEGIEHGMTVFSAPEGDGSLVAEFCVSGDLSISSSGGSIYLLDSEGPVYKYSGIEAWDSSGRALASSMTISGDKIIWEADDSDAVYPVTIDPMLTQVKILTASDKASGDLFGYSVSISDDVAVVGAKGADSGGNSRGQAYIFYKDSGGADNWGQVKILTASDKSDIDEFGYSVSLSGDTVVVGARYAESGGLYRGQAYVFNKDSGGADNWGQVKILSASDKANSDQFGYSVSLSNDTVVIGAPYADSGGNDCGQAYVFYKDSGGADNWGEVNILSASDKTNSDYFGYSVSLSNETAIVGAYYADSGGSARGQAYVFYKDSGGADNWGEVKILTASDRADADHFGNSVYVNNGTAIVGAKDADSGISNSGKAYIFYKDSGGVDNWGEVKILTASDKGYANYFGSSVFIANGTAIVGAPDANSGGSDRGQVYLFSKDSGGADNWGEVQVLAASDKANDNKFGSSVSASGETILIGALGAGSGGVNRGQAYVFINASAPTFTGILPSSGAADNASAGVVISGTNFYTTPEVTLKKSGQDDINATGVLVSAGHTTIACSFNLTGASPGKWDVNITNPDMQSVNAANAFTVLYGAPIYSGITPSSGAADNTSVNVTIKGMNFYNPPAVILKKSGQADINATGVLVSAGNTTITCSFNLTGASPGMWDVNITNPDMQSVNAADKFKVLCGAPVFAGIAPSSGAADNASAGVIITGINFYGTPVVKLKKAGQSDITAENVSVPAGNTSITCSFNLTGASPGMWDVNITNPDMQSVNAVDKFTVLYGAPIFSGIVPSTGTTGNPAVAVTVSGANFYSSPLVALKKSGQSDINATGVLVSAGNKTITCSFDLTGATTGMWDINITNPDMKSVNVTGVFTVNAAPTPAPTAAPSGGGSSSGGGSNSDTGVGASKHLKAGDSASFDFNGKGAVYDFSVKVTEDTPELMVTVHKQSYPPSVGAPDTDVYEYEDVKMYHADASAVSGGVFEFRVAKAWLSKNGYTKGDVVMLHYINDKWVALPTVLIHEDNTYVYYSSETPSFSWFAIGIAVGETIIPGEETEVIPTKTNAPVSEEIPSAQTVPAESVSTDAADPKSNASGTLPAFALVAVIAVVAGAAALTWRRRKED
ncbi:PGF-pre-PGF domain-containing protein [Methanoplanus endosymbiosus]|uniref:PGF-pre-PGF domain-containing protein n=1 Tax=Methanoplanus endosymbiosus TaxID=33865 RepID=A0A9E7PPZ9_9EURY|nr:PGF-pre-PGF domain-containing protein [Methanoplanus endosymbiosus]UUX93317.1 PGF-pre-PGF domain-containing protein [Methanoplanus endosymbiosus]